MAQPGPRASAGALKTYLVLFLFLALRAVGNSAMAWGMKTVPEKMAVNPLVYVLVMVHPFVALGITALMLSLLTRMALLSLADLSFVLPVTAIGYVVSVVIGRILLHETVSPERWAGTLLIFAGAIMVGTTSSNTTPRPVNS